MDEFHRNTGNNESQTTPFQTPVRGADEQPGSGYAGMNTEQNTEHTQDTAASGGSTPPPHDGTGSSAYEQWSGGKKPKKDRPHKHRTHKVNWKSVVAVVVVAALAFGGGMLARGGIDLSGLTAGSSNSGTTADGSGLPEDSTKMQVSDTSSSGDDKASYAGVYEKVSPSIVSIVVDEIQMGSESSGSGVIMSEDGYVITNNHVVEGGDKITVVMSDSTTYEAELIGTDEQTDLAVLKIDKTGLTAAEFGSSDDVQVGDRAFAIGSPGGVEFQNSFTGGFISAINRNVTINDRVMTLIQTDTAINPGNSGGALINSDGQVIGITSSKLSSTSSSSDSTSFEGMGFAIPTTTVKEVVDQLIAYGHVTGRPAIGISGYDIDQMRATYYSIPQGVMVTSVDSASDAYKQGVKEGDIITGVNGTDVTCMSDVNTIKNDMKAGDSMELTIYRSGKTITVKITLIDQADLAGTSTSTDNSDSSSSQEDGSTNPYGSSGGSYSYGYTIP